MKTRILLVALAALLVAADDEAVSKARKTFKGEWTLSAATFDGQALAKDMIGDQGVIFDGTTYKQLADGKVLEEGTFEIDPAADPKTLTFVIESGNDKGKKQLGLYRFEEGDKSLTLSLARPGEDERPKALDSKSGSGRALLVFDRKAEKDKGDK